jgi:hypothetical protein
VAAFSGTRERDRLGMLGIAADSRLVAAELAACYRAPRYSWTSWIAIEPSPTAEATRLIDR